MDLRSASIVFGLALTLASCGAGELSLTEYASEVETLVAEMETRFAEIDAEWLSQSPSVAGAQEYWDDRMDIRNDFLASIRKLEPPEEVRDQHDAAIDVFGRINDGDSALRSRVDQYTTLDEHWQWVNTPEGRAADLVLEEVFAFCRASQEEFDATKERESFDEMPWLPSQMKEVVRVAFGCPPS
ncbi:MAG: hypothetical protein QNJ81_13765 [Acidimicrobiia bacterium]|nr:hypothetical protein [Acidimicrobiia bacterium]